MKNLSNKNVVHIKKDGIEYLQFRKLLEFSNIINHAYSLGIDKDFRTESPFHTPIDKENEKQATENYKKIANAINSDYTHIIKARQMHTKEVRCVEEKENEPEFCSDKYEKTDGLITNKSNIMLSTTNADCILLLFFDPVKKVIANAHSGWRGTLKKISVETVNKMQKTYGSKPQDIICCICPSIRKCHFEVERDVKDLFQNEFDYMDSIIEETVENKKWHIDTIKINIELLKQARTKSRKHHR